MNNINQKTPEGWSVKKISDLGNVVSGGTPDTNNPEYWDGNVLWVTPSEVSTLSNRFISNTERKITEKGLKESSAKLLPINSLIICTRATIGDCCINKKPICTNQGFKNIIVTGNNVDFLYYLISKNKHELIRKACGSTFLEISKKDIDNLKFPIPPLPEQEKIAGILGTWDEAIEKLSSLIEQKKNFKKGLMQKLLTGKVRLPGFTQPWKEVKLGNFCRTFSGGTPSVNNASFYDGNIPFIRSGEIHLTSTALFISESGLTNSAAKLVEKGDILFALYGATSGEVDISKINGAINQAILCIKPLSLNKYFLKDILEYKKQNILNKYLQGGQGNLSAEIIKSLKIYIPSDISEQQAIANVLSTADDEIDLLNKKLILFKEQKKGLMQQLLTGNIRVKVK